MLARLIYFCALNRIKEIVFVQQYKSTENLLPQTMDLSRHAIGGPCSNISYEKSTFCFWRKPYLSLTFLFINEEL